MPSPSQVLRELLEAAVLWRKTKVSYLAATERKHADESKVTKLRKEHMQAVGRLERAVLAFEQLPQTLRKAVTGKKPVDWKKLVDSVATAATALSKATDAQRPIDMSRVIDVVAED
jgi:hypothetical protein